MQDNRSELLHMLKYGRADEVPAYVNQLKKEEYTDDFCSFMDQMIKEHKMSRKKVAVRAGLSQDYTYKLLRGDKHTDERDYILAICFALEMSLAQTQHALSIYGMPMLSEADLRSHIIILAIEENNDIDELNHMLERAGFPLLKISPDMPSAPITNSGYGEIVQASKAENREFTEIDSFTEGHHNGGNAPFDYDYQGWIKVKDEAGNIYQVEAVFASDYTSFLVFTEEQRKKAEELMMIESEAEEKFYHDHEEIMKKTNGYISPFEYPELYEQLMEIKSLAAGADMLESYDSLSDAANSEFFPFFLEIDKRTDKKVIEVMKELDDTRNYHVRIGSSWQNSEHGPQIHIEVFNDTQPELREYFQIVEYQDGTCRYTATHESCYMRLEMGKDLYETYFGKRREPEYYIDTTENKFSGNMVRYRFIFNGMKIQMHEHVLKHGAFVKLDPEKVDEEKIEAYIEQSVNFHRAGEHTQAIEPLQRALQILEAKDLSDPSRLTTYICTCAKMAWTAEDVGDQETAEAYWAKIYGLRNKIVLADAKTDDNAAVSVLVDTIMHFIHRIHDRDNIMDAKPYLEEAIELIEKNNASSDDWETLYEIYGSYAVIMEDIDTDKSLKLYRKATSIGRNHHLDMSKRTAYALYVSYNNYAWMLWNRCGSEEAILHYGKALDLLESYLYTGVIPREKAMSNLAHVGTALNKIYTATNRPRESADLKERLMENGITIE